MRKKAFLSISYKNKDIFSSSIDGIVDALKKLNIDTVVFVRQYSFVHPQEKEMMQKAMAEIHKCDFLIAEVSDKTIGVGIEMGYARGIGKPILYLKKENAQYSTVVGGISDYHIVYHNISDLKEKITKIIPKI